jgi:hypothetical protein
MRNMNKLYLGKNRSKFKIVSYRPPDLPNGLPTFRIGFSCAIYDFLRFLSLNSKIAHFRSKKRILKWKFVPAKKHVLITPSVSSFLDCSSTRCSVVASSQCLIPRYNLLSIIYYLCSSYLYYPSHIFITRDQKMCCSSWLGETIYKSLHSKQIISWKRLGFQDIQSAVFDRQFFLGLEEQSISLVFIAIEIDKMVDHFSDI